MDDDGNLDESGELYAQMEEGKKDQSAAYICYKSARKEERRRVHELKKNLAALEDEFCIHLF